MKSAALSVASLVLTMSAAVAQAHHSYAMFDLARSQTIQGTVETIEWGNPHVWIWVVQTDDRGAGTTFGFETISPGELTRFFGWTKHSLNVGDHVTVDYMPLRSGRNGGALKKVTLANGRVLLTQMAT